MRHLIKTLQRLILVTVMLSMAGMTAAAGINIVPKPTSVTEGTGHFTLTQNTTIGYEPQLKELAEYLAMTIASSTGWDPVTSPDLKHADITLSIDAKGGKPEGYTLTVTPKSIAVTGSDAGGAFYGVQSLLQLFPAAIYSDKRVRGVEWTAPAVKITDAPERPWRGMMLDVARYFFDKEFVKKYIDMMAMYKLNKLQFHLIDDSGWRLEIKKYPRLTEVGAWAGKNGKRIGGYYTQDDIRELVEYGRLRNVEIIPEIEFPAHILSAVVAYPWLSCTGEQHEVPDQHFISRDLLCAGKQTSIDFLKDVLDETVELFPSSYINIGGDEAVYTRWAECPDCRALMEREGITKPADLQGYLTNVVSEMMKEKGRTVIGWEEIIQRGKVNNPVVALIWHNTSDSIQATETGHKAILTPGTHMYLDFPEGKTPGEVKAATWMPPISLEKAYSLEVNDYSPTSTVIGVQGCLWSDQFIHGTVLQEITPINENRSENYMEYLTFPRMMAVAEVGWGKQRDRDYADFARRVSTHYPRLDYQGFNYRVPEPAITAMKENADGSVTFTLAPSVDGSEIRYTTDGSYPHPRSPLYSGPVTVGDKSDFHAITVVNDRHYSLPIYFAPDYSAYEKYGEYMSEWSPLKVQHVMTPWKIDATGKIRSNGEYEITFIPTKGADALTLGDLAVFKRDEEQSKATAQNVAVKPGAVKSYRVSIDQFEAGTPFTVTVEAGAPEGNETSGLVFIRKID